MSSMMRGNFRLAIASVRAAKGRSLLTMLGVVVGIVSVVTVIGLGEGLKRQVSGAISQFGSDLITIRPGNGTLDEGLIKNSDVIFGQSQTGGLPVADVETVRKVPSVQLAAPLGVVPGVVQAEGQQLRGGRVLATSSELPKLLNQKLAFGTMWSNGQETGNFALLGSKAAMSLFGEPAPLGQKLTLRGETFIVRAVFEDFEDVPLSPTTGFDQAVFIPYLTANRITEGRSQAYVVLARPIKPERFDAAVTGIAEALKKTRGGEQDFEVQTPKEHLASSSRVFDLLSTWIMAVAAISLVIGGVGLMNIMLVAVSERMHEIGVRKAVGATQRQILWQFLLEAMVLSGVGGLVGVLFSLLAHGALLAYTDLQPVLSWQAMVLAVGVALAIGIIFGTIPAVKAASKDPIEALRHE